MCIRGWKTNSYADTAPLKKNKKLHEALIKIGEEKRPIA